MQDIEDDVINHSEITAILVDDEINASKNLKHLLHTYAADVKILGSFQDVPDAVREINEIKPDVVFLDISMPRETGFDLLNKLQYLPHVIFVTAHDKFALRAIKLCAVDFILKPVHPNDLIKAVDKIRVILSLQNHLELIQSYKEVYTILNNHLHNTGIVKKICIPALNGYGYHVLHTNEIIHITGDDNYSIFNLLTNDKLMVSRTLKDYEDLLDGFGFFRVHKSCIINLNHLVKTVKQDNLKVVMTDGAEINVSRRRGPLLLEKIRMIS